MRVYVLLVVVILCLACLALTARTAAACSCMLPTPQQAFDRYEVIFLGAVTSIQEIETDFGPMHRVTFQPKTRWKGNLSGHLELLTETNGATCGVSFMVGGDFLVYANYETHLEALHTHLCSRTGLAEYALDDLEFLGPGEALTPALPTSWGTIKAMAR